MNICIYIYIYIVSCESKLRSIDILVFYKCSLNEFSNACVPTGFELAISLVRCSNACISMGLILITSLLVYVPMGLYIEVGFSAAHKLCNDPIDLT